MSPMPAAAIAASHRCRRVPCSRGCGAIVTTRSPRGEATCDPCKKIADQEYSDTHREEKRQAARERYHAQRAAQGRAPRPAKHDPAQVYGVIAAHPGIIPAELRRLLDYPGTDLGPLLATLDNHGYLLSEDERGRLYPFEARAGGVG